MKMQSMSCIQISDISLHVNAVDKGLNLSLLSLQVWVNSREDWLSNIGWATGPEEGKLWIHIHYQHIIS